MIIHSSSYSKQTILISVAYLNQELFFCPVKSMVQSLRPAAQELCSIFHMWLLEVPKVLAESLGKSIAFWSSLFRIYTTVYAQGLWARVGYMAQLNCKRLENVAFWSTLRRRAQKST